MNHHKWLQKELEKWRMEGIVPESVVADLQRRYPVTSVDTAGLIMFFAALLTGLGGILFIASNWDIIPDLAKLGIILLGMTGFYGAGESLRYKGRVHLGLSLIFLGTLLFGAGIFLIGQMFHIVAYNAVALLVWSLGTASIAWLYRNPYMMITAVLQWAAASLFQSFNYSQNPSWILAFGVIFLVISYHWKSRQILSVTLAGVVVGIVSVFGYFDTPELWAYPVLLAIFAASLVFCKSSFRSLFQYPMLLTMYIGVFIQLFLFNVEWNSIENSVPAYWSFAVILLWMAALMWRFKILVFLPLVLILLPTPFFPLSEIYNAIAALGVSVYILSLGEKAQERAWINHGTILFLISVFILYVRNAWSLLDSSLFFVAGGLLLFILAIFMESRRRKLLASIGEAK